MHGKTALDIAMRGTSGEGDVLAVALLTILFARM